MTASGHGDSERDGSGSEHAEADAAADVTDGGETGATGEAAGTAGQPSATAASAAEAPPPQPEDEQAEAEAPEAVAQRLQEELEQVRAQHARAAADYQNLRRRSEEERREQARLAMKALVINYLPVLDDLRRALSLVDGEIAQHQWVKGVRIVERKFTAVLEASGVREIETAGCQFDPALHEAVAYQPGPQGEVVGQVEVGYTIDGDVMRPALVLVGNGEPAPDADASSGDEDGGAPAAQEEDTREDGEG